MKLTKIDEAAYFLQGLLTGGPIKCKDIYDLAFDRGISDKALTMAKRDLGIKSVKMRDETQRMIYCWELPKKAA